MRIPDPRLQPYVKMYLFSRIGNGSAVTTEVFPIGYNMLSFVLNEAHFVHDPVLKRTDHSRFIFTGQFTSFRQLQASSVAVVYVFFKPYGAYRLMGIPQHELLNDNFDLNLLAGKEAGDIYAKLLDNAVNPDKVISLLEEWLLQRLAHPSKKTYYTDRIAYVCNIMSGSVDNLSMKELYNAVNMSKSSFERNFKMQVGMTPKLYSRIVRFNQVYNFLKRQSHFREWKDLVYNYGYFDQAHFIHEFKEFFGSSPSHIYENTQSLSAHLSTQISDIN